MKKMVFFLCIVFVIYGKNCQAALTWVPFTVTRHVDSSYSESTFDNAMTDINTSLKYDNHHCADDVPCSARFYRSGSLGIFGTAGDGLDLITTQDELDSVFAVTTHRAKMVTAIDYCDNRYNPSFVGCGKVDGFGFIVEIGEPGLTFVHEYGHNVGLYHRDDCDMNIMNTYSNGSNDSLNTSECSTYGGNAYTVLCGTVYNGYGGPLTESGGPYWITCDVVVPAGQTLTIEAGTEIQFEQGSHKIISYGTTSANGATSRIMIYSNNATNNFPTSTIEGPLTISNGGELLLE
jgi:hypothetical protein